MRCGRPERVALVFVDGVRRRPGGMPRPRRRATSAQSGGSAGPARRFAGRAGENAGARETLGEEAVAAGAALGPEAGAAAAVARLLVVFLAPHLLLDAAALDELPK